MADAHDYSNKDRTPQEFASDSQKFLQDAYEVVSSTGMRVGVQRARQGAFAALETLFDVTKDAVGSLSKGGQSLTSLQDIQKALADGVDAPRALRKLCERLGATYIKVGQFIASSPTLFPPEYVREFQKCLDRTEPVPWRQMRAIMEEDLGQSITDVFSFVNTKPLASASVAQVYEARLRTGEDVVIKVQKPGVGDVLGTDLGFIYLVTRLVELVNPNFASRLSISDIVQDIRTSMLNELDFEKEAQNVQDFRDFVEREGLGGIATAPLTYPQASSKRVLTMERLRGVALTDLEGIRQYSPDPEQTLISALNTWTLSIMKCPSFHADVHAGNLLVLEDGRVGFIDFGIVGKFSPRTWEAVSQLANSVVLQDFKGIAEALYGMGATIGPVDADRFAADLEKLWAKFNALDPLAVAAASGGEMNINEVADQEVTGFLLDVVSTSEKNGLRLPREFGLLIKQQLYFDRYTRILAPTLDPLRDSRVQLQRAAGSGGGSTQSGAAPPPRGGPSTSLRTAAQPQQRLAEGTFPAASGPSEPQQKLAEETSMAAPDPVIIETQGEVIDVQFSAPAPPGYNGPWPPDDL